MVNFDAILNPSNNNPTLCPATILRGETPVATQEVSQAIETLKAQKQLHALGMDYSGMPLVQMQIELEAHNLVETLRSLDSNYKELSKPEDRESDALANILKKY